MDNVFVAIMGVFLSVTLLRFYFTGKFSFISKKKETVNNEVSTINEIPDTPLKIKTTSRKNLEDWSLLLHSQGIINTFDKEGVIVKTLLVPERLKAKAESLILDYKEESSDSAASIKEITLFKTKLFPTIAIFILLFLFHIFVHRTDYSINWLLKGRASAEDILAGEYWRTITSLTLHSDFGHLLSNVTTGFVASLIVSLQLGSGFGWFLILLSGSLGNYLNALFYGTSHNSIGASTAVFAAIGIICGLQIYREYRKRKWIPIVIGLSFFALMGTGGERTDITAHLFGLVAGFLIGSLIPLILKKKKINESSYQQLWAFLAELLVITSWSIALYF